MVDRLPMTLKCTLLTSLMASRSAQHGYALDFLLLVWWLRSPVTGSEQNDWVVFATGSATSGGTGKPVSADFRVAFGFQKVLARCFVLTLVVALSVV